MLQVSDAYKELVKSNIRPKCEPIIKVSGVDNNGNDIELVWNAKNIKDLTYKRSIDPVGRELPYMELTWTEIYTGKLNAENYPEKYNNIIQYMQVELSFVQDLGFYNTWKTLFSGEITWKDLFNGNIKWKQLKNQVSQETITMPKLFLSGKPTISGQTITWTARDLLSFINENQVWEFDGSNTSLLSLKNAISFFVLNARSGFLKSPSLFNAYTNSVDNILNEENGNNLIDKRIICDGNTNDILLNLASIYNYHLSFKNDVVTLKPYEISSVSAIFDSKVLYQYPTIEKSMDISNYSFKHREVQTDVSKAYYKNPYGYRAYGNNVYELFYLLDGYGEAYYSADNLNERMNTGSLKSVSRIGEFEHLNQQAYVIPIDYVVLENNININSTGEPFNEDNKINPYDAQSTVATDRKNFLNGYFTSNSSSISFEALSNLAVETDDVIEVETNLYDGENRITKKALVVSIELSYNGSLKQKIKAHEVQI